MLEAAKKGSSLLTVISIISSDTPTPTPSACEKEPAQVHNPLFHARCASQWFDFRMMRAHLVPWVG